MIATLIAVIPTSDPLPLPSPPWLLWSLLMLTWVLHVIAMNFVLGGSIIAAAARVRTEERGHRMAAFVGRLMPTAVAAAITFGVAPLLFVQALYGRLFFSSAVLMAWSWFAVVPILIVAYYGTYVLSFSAGKLGRAAGIIGIVVALLFLSISFIYSNNMSLMLRPETFIARYLQDARGLQLNLSDPTLVARWLHMVLGAIAVAAMTLAIYGVVQRRTDDEYGKWVVHHGAIWFAVATALNILAGAWWTAALPRHVLAGFMGVGAGTLWIASGIVFGLAALMLMIGAMKSPSPDRLVKWGASTLAVSVVAMALTRDEVRRGMLQLADFRLTDRIAPQWDVIALFAVLLVAAVGTTVWMAFAVLRPRPDHGDVASAVKPPGVALS